MGISGRKIEESESPQEALQRKIVEGMHYKIAIGDQIEHTIYEYDFGIVHLTIFYCKLAGGKPVLHASIKWLSSDELKSLDWVPADIPAIEKLSNTSIKK